MYVDTCHIHDSGYDIVNDYEGVINKFEEVVGIHYLKVIHINDSKNARGSHKDRHENIVFISSKVLPHSVPLPAIVSIAMTLLQSLVKSNI